MILSLHFHIVSFLFFFFNDTATTEIYTLSLHDALPISLGVLHRECDKAKPPVGLQVEPGRQKHAAPAASTGRRDQQDQNGGYPAGAHAHRRLKGWRRSTVGEEARPVKT